MNLHSALPAFQPRVVLMDVDDTIAPSTMPVSPAMAAALDGLCAKGIALVFVSGGSVEHMWGQVTRQLARPHVLLGTSGSHAVDVLEGGPESRRQELFNHGFSPAERAEILGALQALIDHYHVVPDTNFEDQLQDRGCQFTLSALGRKAAEARKRAFDPDGAVRREWVAFLERRLGNDRFSMRVGGTSSIDITAKGVDKGSGVRELLAIKGWAAADCLFFGDRFEDTGNDRPVLAVMDCVVVENPDQTLAHFRALLAR
ncbi:MAG TPA: HAD-IIB family hydrolase [bacterium]|nr:HAD-IIB family hydrolase [bacterium]